MIASLGRLLDLAEDQWGLFTRRQAESAGMAWSTLSRLVDAGGAERVAHGVYRFRGAPPAEHLELRAAWLQLAPGMPVWSRLPEQGIVAGRSAAALYGLGHLPADIHEFALPERRQTRRSDVHLRQAQVPDDEWANVGGLLTARPSRVAADLLADREDPGAVAQIVVDAFRSGREFPDMVARSIAPFAASFGLAADDGVELLGWLLDLAPDRQRDDWLARVSTAADDAFAMASRGDR